VGREAKVVKGKGGAERDGEWWGREYCKGFIKVIKEKRCCVGKMR